MIAVTAPFVKLIAPFLASNNKGAAVAAKCATWILPEILIAALLVKTLPANKLAFAVTWTPPSAVIVAPRPLIRSTPIAKVLDAVAEKTPVVNTLLINTTLPAFAFSVILLSPVKVPFTQILEAVILLAPEVTTTPL